MAWLTGFNNRLKLTISADNVDSSLTDFPVMINLSTDSGLNSYDASAVFDELSDANYKRIAVTIGDGTTQCPVEIDYWDSIGEKAVLWTKVPTVYSTVGTDMYLYFDATYSGTTASGNVDYVGDINDTTYQMVVDINQTAYDTTHAYYHCVIKESDTSYKMWYTGNDGSNNRILYATSTDGVVWTGNQMVININNISYDSTSASAPWVIKDGSTYKMWYTGRDSTNDRIIYATSTNGTTWTGHTMVLDYNQTAYDTTHASYSCVIKESASSYKMWYSGYGGAPIKWRILYATSTDGITWSNHQMVINIGAEGTYDTSNVLAPCVLKEDSIYRMWYAGHDGSYWRGLYATSTNGTTWGNFEMVLNINCQGIYDTGGAGIGIFVINEDGVDKAWYGGVDGVNWRIMRSTYWKNPAQDVWDDNFVGVWHMGQNPAGDVSPIKDSTFNTNNGTIYGSMISDDLIDGKVGKAIDFDGDNDYIDLGPGLTSILQQKNWTASFLIKDVVVSDYIFNHRKVDNTDEIRLRVPGAFSAVYDEHAVGDVTVNGTTTITDGESHLVVATVNTSTLSVYTDGSLENTGDVSGSGALVLDDQNIMGTRFLSGVPYTPGSVNYLDGSISEARISDTDRSAAWIKADYYSNWDTFIVFQEEEVTTNWLTDWAKRIRLTIDSTNVDSILLDFPVALTVASGTNTAGIFDELSTVSGTKKIAVTTDDGTSQCYVEIEKWDWSAQEANLWAKVPIVNSDEDTILYLYYDSTKSDNTTYVGDIADATARNVWDSNFVGVWHTSQDPADGTDAMKDSTMSVNHGTWAGYGGSNLAQGKTCAQSSDGGGVCGNAVDGSTATYNHTSGGTNEWWKVDLGAEYAISHIQMVKRATFGSDRPKTYYIQTADDWAFTTNVTNLISKVDELSYDISFYMHELGPISARYLRVYAHTTNQYLNIAEFRVYGPSDYGSVVDGKIGKAVDFDGGDDAVCYGSGASLDDIGTITVEAIFKAASWGESLNGRMICKCAVGNENGWNLFIAGTGGANKLGFLQGWSTTDGSWYGPNSTITLDDWYYVAGQYDRSYSTSDVPLLYINGVSSTVTTAVTPAGSIESDTAQTMLTGARPATAGYDREFDGIIDEIRISNIHRSAAWIKATYYSNWNQLITYETEQDIPVDPTHYYYGYITEDSSPAARTVRVYNRDTGALMSSTTSDAGSGYYYLTTTISGEHYIVTLDSDEGLDFNALVLDRLSPRGIE